MHTLLKEPGFVAGWNARNPSNPAASPVDTTAIATLSRLRRELEASIRTLHTQRARDYAVVAVSLAGVLLCFALLRAAPSCTATDTPPSMTIGTVIKLGGC